jgi:hypothetical protein
VLRRKTGRAQSGDIRDEAFGFVRSGWYCAQSQELWPPDEARDGFNYMSLRDGFAGPDIDIPLDGTVQDGYERSSDVFYMQEIANLLAVRCCGRLAS